MKKIIIQILLFTLCFYGFSQEKSELSSNGTWTNEIGIGAASPLKMLFVCGEKSTGFSVQLECFYAARKSNGLTFFAEGAAGPYFYDNLKIGDSKGLCMNMNFIGGVGYDFLKEKSNQSLILAGVIGFDTFIFKDYNYSSSFRYTENTANCFEAGVDLFYAVRTKYGFGFYTGCTILAGLGWTNSKVTKQGTAFDHDEIEKNEYCSCQMLSIFPKIGVSYSF